MLGRSEILLGLGQGRGGVGQTLLSVVEVGQDDGATALQDPAQEVGQELVEAEDHNRQVDDVGLEQIEVQTKTAVIGEEDGESHLAASRRLTIRSPSLSASLLS